MIFKRNHPMVLIEGEAIHSAELNVIEEVELRDGRSMAIVCHPAQGVAFVLESGDRKFFPNVIGKVPLADALQYVESHRRSFGDEPLRQRDFWAIASSVSQSDHASI